MTVETGLIPDIITNTATATADNVATLTATAGRVGIVFNTLSDAGFWKRAGVIAAGVVLVYWGSLLAVAGTRVFKDSVNAGVGAVTKVATKGVV